MGLYRLLLLLMIATGCLSLRCDAVQAQGIGSEWSTPVDIGAGEHPSREIFGALVCDQYQNVHLLWSEESDEGARIFYRTDAAGDWSAAVDVLAFSYRTAVNLQAEIDSTTDILYLSWVDNWLGGNLHYSFAPLATAGDPRAWSSPRELPYPTGGASFDIDQTGTIHLTFRGSESTLQPTLYYIRSEDGALTWSAPVLVYSTFVPVSSSIGGAIAVDDAGRIHVGITVRSDEYGVFSEVGYLRSLDGGRTWGDYTTVQLMGTTFQGVAVLVPYTFGADEVHLTWHDPRRMHQWSYDGGETWSQPIEIMPLGASFGGANALAKDSAGVLHVVVRGDISQDPFVFSAAWDGTRWMAPELIEDREMDAHGQKLIVCQGNQLHVVYDDRLTSIGDEPTVWYSSRMVNAPHIERQSFPPSSPEPTAAPTQDTPSSSVAAVVAGAPTASIQPETGLSLVPSVAPSPLANPMVLSLAAALVVLASAFAFHVLQRNRR